MPSILDKQIDELKNAIESKRLTFLVGAGISMEPPSYLTTWPQSECMRVLTTRDPDTDEESVRALRPEVFFQILNNIIGMRALKPLEILNPATLNSDEEVVTPNLLHFFLARMMLKGHIVLTSNFDDLIERAFERITDGKSRPRVAIFDTDFQSLYEEADSERGCLIKIHGSFLTPNGQNSRGSIVAILQQVQREFPESKRKLVRKITAENDLVVMGYSGRDDFDLYPFLLEPPSNRRIWWIRHSEEKDPEKWQVLLKRELESQNTEIRSQLAPLRDYERLNSNSIVMAYSCGVLIESYTANFVKYLGDWYSPPDVPSMKAKVRKKMQAILKEWADITNIVERYRMLAYIFEALGRDFLNQAQDHHKRAYEIGSSLTAAQNVLRMGTISYKKGGSEELQVAKDRLDEALGEFEKLSSIADQAEASLQLLLVHNRPGGIIEKGIEYGERAVNLYKQLAESDSYYIFELAQALRGVALISIRAIPDISAMTTMQEKEHCTRILVESAKLCETSLRLLQKIGNRSGERGEGQTHNVLGIIKLRLSQNYEGYKEAKTCFDRFLDLSGRSRFLRESFQGYRNVALCEYNLALLEPEKKNEWLDKAIRDYDCAIRCLGSSPEQPNQQPRSTDEFVARYNRSCARIELAEQEDMESVVNELVTLEKTAPNWHWRAKTQSLLCRARLKLGQYEEAFLCVERMVGEYESVEDKDIETQPFGVQNAKQNLQSASDCLSQVAKVKETGELHQKVVEQVGRVGNLSQFVPPVPFRDWSALVSQIEKRFLKKDT